MIAVRSAPKKTVSAFRLRGSLQFGPLGRLGRADPIQTRSEVKRRWRDFHAIRKPHRDAFRRRLPQLHRGVRGHVGHGLGEVALERDDKIDRGVGRDHDGLSVGSGGEVREAAWLAGRPRADLCVRERTTVLVHDGDDARLGELRERDLLQPGVAVHLAGPDDDVIHDEHGLGLLAGRRAFPWNSTLYVPGRSDRVSNLPSITLTGRQSMSRPGCEVQGPLLAGLDHRHGDRRFDPVTAVGVVQARDRSLDRAALKHRDLHVASPDLEGGRLDARPPVELGCEPELHLLGARPCREARTWPSFEVQALIFPSELQLRPPSLRLADHDHELRPGERSSLAGHDFPGGDEVEIGNDDVAEIGESCANSLRKRQGQLLDTR